MVKGILQKRTEELILIILILMNVLEFFNLLPGEAEFVKAIISITGLAYVLYKASLSDIFIGSKHKGIDFLLIFSYLLMIVNKFVEFSFRSLEESTFLTDFFRFIVDHFEFLEKTGFYMGIFMLIILSMIISFSYKIYGPSILNALHGEEMKNRLKRFLITFMVLISFYIIFFNLVMEWLTLVIDAPLVMLAIFFYLFKIHEMGKNMDEEMLLFKVADFVENFVEEFVSLFHSKKTIFLGISGLLVLHLITDVGAFMIPYTTGFHNFYSSEEFELTHHNLPYLFGQDRISLDISGQLMALSGYFLNTLGMLFQMLFPAFIWYIVYKNHVSDEKNIADFPNSLVALFYATLVYLIFLPVYKIGSFTDSNLLGVDITTISILSSGNPLAIYLALSFAVFIIVFLLSYVRILKDIMFFVMTLVNLGFFGMYIFNFSKSFVTFYLGIINTFVLENNILSAFASSSPELIFQSLDMMFLGLTYVLFFGITILFYFGGYLDFIISVFKPEDKSDESKKDQEENASAEQDPIFLG